MWEWWSKLSGTVAGRRGLAEDLHAEIEAHLAFEIQENLAHGMSPEDARSAARRHVGNLTRIEERAREAWSFPRIETFVQDLHYGLRGIRRSPGFSLVVILTLALGIGANTAIFSVVNTVLLRPLPYPAAERLVWLGESDPKAEGISVTWINYLHWRKENHSFEELGGFRGARLTLTGRGEALLTRAGVVTSSFFPLVGAKPLLGRIFNAAEDRPGGNPTVVLSHQFWVDKLGADPGVVGTALTLDGKSYEVTGVLAPGLRFFSPPVDFYLPLALFDGETVDRSRHGSMRLLGRLKPRVALAAALADLDIIMKRLAAADPGPESRHRAYGIFLAESNTGAIRPTLLLLLGAVGLVLLIACANVAGLALARGTARAREMAVRTAVGASRARLIRQWLTENLLLAALGGVAGWLLAGGCLRVLIDMGPRDIPRLAETTFDWQVGLFAGAITLLTGLLTGFAPIWAAGKSDLVGALKDGSRSATGGKNGHTVRSALVVAEMAITLALTFAAGLLVRSLIATETANPGFAPGHVLALELVLPGVASVGAVRCPPSAGDCGDWFYSILDRPAPQPGEVPIALFNTADLAYFSALQIPLREGRGFSAADRRSAPRVAIVNETFARKWWPRQSAVGHRIKSGGPYRDGPIYEIVGVAGDVSQMGLDTEPWPEIYLPFSQSPSEAMVMMLRVKGDPESLAPAIRRRVAEIDRNLPIESLRPFERSLAASLAQRRFSTLLLALFAGLAMTLAGVGVYGLLNYWVRVRQEEIAIRLALGAPRRAILRWAGRQVLRLAVAGGTLGMLAGWMASRWLASLVFGVSPRSGTTMAAATATVMGMAVIAAAIPVWRATKVDALDNLHHL